QLQTSQPVGTVLMVILVGAVVSIVCLVPVLAWLNRQHVELRAARGLPIGDSTPLEVMLVVTAALAIVGFAIWFFGFSGSSPVPISRLSAARARRTLFALASASMHCEGFVRGSTTVGSIRRWGMDSGFAGAIVEAADIGLPPRKVRFWRGSRRTQPPVAIRRV